jgi:mRNA-degrading endonuclease RelE of RelBE toxin-antitoxin system
MPFEIKTIPHFDRNFKKLKKKYPSFYADMMAILETLPDNPTQGVGLGKDCYKIRIAITSKGKGKSGGARLITYVYFSREYLYLIAVYDKAEHETISEKELETLINNIE